MKPRLIREAKGYASRIAESSFGLVETVLLDQWRRSKEKDEWRLTYLGQKIGTCSNACHNCSVYNAAGGEDNSADKRKLVTTLSPATEKDLRDYEGKQYYVNCKSLDQYITSFVRCFQGECHSHKEISDELDYVAGFKVVYHQGQEKLETIEEGIRKRVIQETLNLLDEPRRKLFIDICKEKMLLK